MGEIILGDGYKIIQHEENKDVIIWKDNRVVKRMTASRYMKDAELIQLFEFMRDVTGGLEYGKEQM